MLCSKCKKEIPDDSVFCPYCSTAVAASATHSPFKRAGDLGGADSGPVTPPPPVDGPLSSSARLYCPNCGASLEADAVFCGACGTKVNSGTAGGGYIPPNPTPPRPVQPPSTWPAGGADTAPGRNAVWALCTSPLALVAIITYSLSILFSLFSTISGPSGVMGQVASYLRYLVDDAYVIVQTAYKSAMFVSLVPAILVAVGLWLTYVSAAHRSTKTTGLTIIKVIVIIQFVFLCIGLACCLIGVVAAVAVASDYGDAMGVVIGVIIVLAIVAALCILYYVKVIQTINTIKITFLSGNPSAKVSAYVAVLSFISGGISVISAFLSGGVLPALSGLCTAAASITFGAFIFSYRTKMRLL